MKKTVLILTLALASTSAFAKHTATTPATTPSHTTTLNKPTTGAIIHINSASVDELTKLPGVSKVIAADIVKNRPYKDDKELVAKVKGIGKNNVKKILPLIDFK